MGDEQETISHRPAGTDGYVSIGSVVVAAERMEEGAFLSKYLGVTSFSTTSGYRVIDKDGKSTWTTKGLFEAMYRKVTSSEHDLLAPGGHSSFENHHAKNREG